jgi:hypothetical protein
MSWTRGKYYHRTTRVGKRVRSEYVGSGPAAALIAQFDQLDQERRALERAERRQQFDQLDQDTRPPTALLDHAGIVAELVRAALELSGYHQHRRQWRKRRMQNQITTAPTRAEFTALFNAASAEGSTAADRAALRRAVASHPEYGRAFDLADRALDALIEGMPADRAGKAIAAGRADSLRKELSGAAPTVLERLLIDQIVLAYMHLNLIEYQQGPLMGGSNASMATIEFWERRLDGAQRRYLRAIESLTRVRRLLNLPGPQVNINLPGGQQVNIAGDVTP